MESIGDAKSPILGLQQNEIHRQSAQELMDMIAMSSGMIRLSLQGAKLVLDDQNATTSQKLAAFTLLQQGARLQLQATKVALDMQKAFKVEVVSKDTTTHLPPEIGTDDPEV